MSARMRPRWLSPSLRAGMLLLAASCLPPCVGATAQTPVAPTQPAAAHPYRIAGHVVSTSDGHPLRGATLSISTVPGRSVLQSTVSDGTGAFAFEALGAGKYSLLGAARGYLPANYDQHESFSTAIATGAGIDTGALLLRLKPVATLAGRAFDPSGEPIAAAQVTLYHEEHASGKRQIVQAGGTQTDDRGEYTFSTLAEATYFLSVRATPWYAVHGAPFNPGMESPLVTGVDPTLDVAYPLTFFGNGTDADTATPISLKAGERRRADIQLTPVRAIRIAFHFEPGSTGVGVPQLGTQVFNTFEQANGQVRIATPGTMEIVGLAPGQYQVQQRDPKTGSVTRVSMVDASHGPVEIDPTQGDLPGSLLVSLEAASGAKLPPAMRIGLRSSSSTRVDGRVVDEKNQVNFEELSPGAYSLLVSDERHLWQIARMEQVVQNGQPGRALPGDAALQRDNHLRLAGGEALAVKLLISEPGVSVEGLALRKGKPAAGAMIVLVPVDAISNVELFRRDQSDSDGTFVLPDVAAGRYIVIAIEDGWKLEWGKLDVLTPYLLHGVPVEIPASERHAVHLPSPIAVQAR